MIPSPRAAEELQFLALSVEPFPANRPNPPGLPEVYVPVQGLGGIFPREMSTRDWIAVGVAGTVLAGLGYWLATR